MYMRSCDQLVCLMLYRLIYVAYVQPSGMYKKALEGMHIKEHSPWAARHVCPLLRRRDWERWKKMPPCPQSERLPQVQDLKCAPGTGDSHALHQQCCRKLFLSMEDPLPLRSQSPRGCRPFGLLGHGVAATSDQIMSHRVQNASPTPQNRSRIAGACIAHMAVRARTGQLAWAATTLGPVHMLRGW